VESLAVSPDGQTLAAGCGDGTIKLWTIPDSAVLPTGQRRPSLTLVAHQGPVTGLCFTAAGYGLYSSGVEGQIKLWQPTQSEAILTLQFPSQEHSPRRGIFSLILTPDEQTLIAGGENGTIQTWTRD